MAVTTTASLVDYTSNGSSTSYSVPFPFLDEDHLRVSKIDLSDNETVLTLGSNYTVTGGDPTGTVTLTAAVTSGWTVRIMRVVPLAQPVEFRAQGPFSPDTWEAGLDRLVMQVQQLNDGTLLASSYIYDHGDQAGGTLHAAVTADANGFATPAMLSAINGLSSTYKPIAYVPAWGEITSKPTTLTGYGVKTEADGLYKPLSYQPTWAQITSKPTTLSGFGITDAATESEVLSVAADLADLDTRVTVLEGATASSLQGEARYSWNGSNYTVTGDRWDPHGIFPTTATKPATGQAKLTFVTTPGAGYRVVGQASGTTVGDNKLAIAINPTARNSGDVTLQFWNVQSVAVADVNEFTVQVFY